VIARLLALVFVLSLLIGCGGGGGSSAKPDSIRVEPLGVTLRPGRSFQFTAFVGGGAFPKLTWSATGGTVATDGTYTAPDTPGDYQVTVTVTDDPSLSARANVTVTGGVNVQITNPTPLPLMSPRSTLDLNAAVTGATNTEVTWRVSPSSAGSINADGLFTASDTPGDAEIIATSVEEPSKSARVPVSVAANVAVRMTIEGKGEIVLRMNTDRAPITTGNFVSLVNKQFYNGIRFHRYEPGFVIQGGDPLTKTEPLDDPDIGTGGPGYTIPFEDTGLLNIQYAVAMASTGRKVGGGSQFYICLEDEPSLDGDYAVFGMTETGKEIVLTLRRGDTIVSAVVER